MKKLIAVLLVAIMALALCACGSSEGEESEASDKVTILDCVSDISVEEVEDGVIYWNVKFNKKFDDEYFTGLDFYDVIKECLSKEENKDSSITDYSVLAYDSNDMLRFAWGYPDAYDPIHEYDENGKASENDYLLTKDMYNDLLEVLE